MNTYKKLVFDGYEEVIECFNSEIGFKAWIAIHSSTLGPALGGCRLWNYGSESDAVTDVLRLSKGMTYKNALAKLPLGGGKSVIHVDPKKADRKKIFKAMGEFIDKLNGRYITAEDVNTSIDDMSIISSETQHVASLNGSGNPSPMTAYGVFCGIKASVEHRLGKQDLNKLVVAIQGVGQTGQRLAKLLREQNCIILAADVNKNNLKRLSELIDFIPVHPDEITRAKCDVFAPCALGGVLNDETIPHLNCSIVAGSANNQLLNEDNGLMLLERDILYAPDFVINSGGIINISCEIHQTYDVEKAKLLTAEIGQTLTDIFKQSDKKRIPTNIIANKMAEKIFMKSKSANAIS